MDVGSNTIPHELGVLIQSFQHVHMVDLKTISVEHRENPLTAYYARLPAGHEARSARRAGWQPKRAETGRPGKVTSPDLPVPANPADPWPNLALTLARRRPDVDITVGAASPTTLTRRANDALA